MGIKVQKLRGRIIEENYTQAGVADLLKMNRSTFYRKMKTGGKTFTVGDIKKMKVILHLDLDDVSDIFLK